MNCPACDHDKVTILEKRGERRRRECDRCLNRWTTYEVTAERLQKLERLEEAVADAMGIELPKPPPPPEREEWRPSAEQLTQWEAERRARDEQKQERERRERLRKAYDQERKERGW